MTLKSDNMADDKYYCPVEATIQLLNRKYILNILKDIFEGKHHFNEFLESNPKLTNKSLSRGLKYLCDNDLIEKSDFEDSTEYNLTEKSKNLKNLLKELANYTKNNNDLSDEKRKELESITDTLFNS